MASTGKVLMRTTWVIVLGAAAGAAWIWKRDQIMPPEPDSPPEWPSFSTADVPTPNGSTPAPAETTQSSGESLAATWVAPLDDGSCPASNPIKAKESSGIFHVPGGRFYDRTKPDRCYADADAATADGYRQSKS